MPRRIRYARRINRRVQRGVRYPKSSIKYKRKKYYNKIYNYKRQMPTIPFIGVPTSRTIQQANTITHLASEFMLNQLPGVSEFINLYDQYKISKIVVKFTPMTTCNATVTMADSGGAPIYDQSENPGLIGSVLDFDDAAPLGSIDDYYQYQNLKTQPCVSRRPHVRVIYPKVRKSGLVAGGGQQPYVIGKSGWIDCNYPEVPHYGLKTFIDARTSTFYEQHWQLETIMHLKFKNVR